MSIYGGAGGVRPAAQEASRKLLGGGTLTCVADKLSSPDWPGYMGVPRTLRRELLETESVGRDVCPIFVSGCGGWDWRASDKKNWGTKVGYECCSGGFVSVGLYHFFPFHHGDGKWRDTTRQSFRRPESDAVAFARVGSSRYDYGPATRSKWPHLAPQRVGWWGTPDWEVVSNC